MKNITVTIGQFGALLAIFALILTIWAVLFPPTKKSHRQNYDGIMYTYTSHHAWGSEIKLIESNENNSSVDCRIQCLQDSNCQAAVYYKKEFTPKKENQCWLLAALSKSKVTPNECCTIYTKDEIGE